MPESEENGFKSSLSRSLNRRDFIRKTAIAGASVGSLLTGFSYSSFGSSDQLGLLLGSHMNYLDERADIFADEHGVEVNRELVTTTELRTKQVTTFITRTSPWDSVFVTANLNAELSDRDWLIDLTDRADELWGPEKEGLLEGSFEAGTLNGRTTAIPVTIGCPFLIWNTELMEEVGLDPKRPKEWHDTEDGFDEFIEYAKAMTREVDGTQHYGFVDAWGDDACLYFFRYQVQAREGDLFDEEGVPLLTSEPCVTSLQVMVDMLHEHEIIDPGSVTYDWCFDSGAPFWDGTRGMIRTWPFMVDQSNDPETSDIVGKVDCAPNPAVKTSASTDGSEFLAIPSYSDNIELGWEYIKFVTSKEMQKLQGENTGWVPIYKDLLTDPDVVENMEFAPTVEKTYEYPTKAYWSVDYEEWTDALQSEIHRALRQRKSPQEALEDAQDEIKKMRGM